MIKTDDIMNYAYLAMRHALTVKEGQKTGAVIVNEKFPNKLVIGKNTPEGVFENFDPSSYMDDLGDYLPHIIHAELDAIFSADKEFLQGATMICTHSPCFRCARSMKRVGITTLYYIKKFRGGEANSYLRQNNVNLYTIKNIDPELEEILNLVDDEELEDQLDEISHFHECTH